MGKGEKEKKDLYIEGVQNNGIINHYEYIINSEGTIEIRHVLKPEGKMPLWFPRIGLTPVSYTHLFVPYINDNRAGERYCYSFESYYDEAPLSRMYKDSLAITPLMVELENGKKAVIMEAGLSNYPGMFLTANPQMPHGVKAEFAPYPLETVIGGYDLSLIHI